MLQSMEKQSVPLVRLKTKNFLWRAKMPSHGQGTPIISNGKVFVTSHERIKEDSETGSAIVGICLDAKTGKSCGKEKSKGHAKRI